jgi:hypothetical protein
VGRRHASGWGDGSIHGAGVACCLQLQALCMQGGRPVYRHSSCRHSAGRVAGQSTGTAAGVLHTAGLWPTTPAACACLHAAQHPSTQRPSTQHPSTQRPSTQRPSTQHPQHAAPSTPAWLTQRSMLLASVATSASLRYMSSQLLKMTSQQPSGICSSVTSATRKSTLPRWPLAL